MKKLPGKINIGVSQCLLGDKVRFDAGHKREPFICNVLTDYFEFVPVCPEVDIGLGIPRPPIRLVGDSDNPELVGTKDPNQNFTKRMHDYSERKIRTFDGLSGYILKAKSPTCGLFKVKVYQPKGTPSQSGVGLFARALAERYPNMPIEEEGRLNDAMLRENFLERVYIYRRWQELLASKLTKQKLIEFHTVHKLTIMAHHPKLYQDLGKRMANLKQVDLDGFAQEYITDLMYGLRNYRATRKKNTNVLQHLAGYLKTSLTKEDKAELQGSFESYHQGNVPLIVPITLLQHYFRLYPNEYIANQTYLNPYPREFRLRNLL